MAAQCQNWPKGCLMIARMTLTLCHFRWLLHIHICVARLAPMGLLQPFNTCGGLLLLLGFVAWWGETKESLVAW